MTTICQIPSLRKQLGVFGFMCGCTDQLMYDVKESRTDRETRLRISLAIFWCHMSIGLPSSHEVQHAYCYRWPRSAQKHLSSVYLNRKSLEISVIFNSFKPVRFNWSLQMRLCSRINYQASLCFSLMLKIQLCPVLKLWQHIQRVNWTLNTNERTMVLL